MESRITRIYMCEDSVDGIFSAVYLAWSSRLGHDSVKLEEQREGQTYNNIELFSEYVNVSTDLNLSLKVAKAIREKISLEAYEAVIRTAFSNYIGKADVIYRFLVLGFKAGRSIMENLSNETVITVFKVNKYVNGEAHHLLGFIRFSQQEGGWLTAVIHPKNNVLTLITPHFADRLPKESFIIYDANRQLASIHIPGRQWIIASLHDFNIDKLDLSHEEDEYKDLWKAFFNSIAIKERTNKSLQRNNLPMRFRGDMTEFL